MPGSAELIVNNAIASITLRNDGRMNAIDLCMAENLAAIATALAARADIGAVILRGAGFRAFCAGIDLKYVDAQPGRRAAFAAIEAKLAEAGEAFRRVEAPVIASLSGACFGGGVIIASWADFRFAGDDLKLAIPAIPNGLIYPVSGLKRLREIIGLSAVKRLFFEARPMPPEWLARTGLIDELTPAAALDETVSAFAARVAGYPRRTAASYSRMFRALTAGDIEAAEAAAAAAQPE